MYPLPYGSVIPLTIRARGGRGFTLVELLTVIGIISVLTAILFPVLMNARTKARAARCLHNMQKIGEAIELYVQDNHGFLPPWSVTHPGTAPWAPPSGNENEPHPTVATWDTSIMSYLRNEELLICPDNPNSNGRTARSYAIAQYTQRPRMVGGNQISLGGYRDDIPAPHKTVLIFEKGNNPPGAWGDALGQNVYQYHDEDMPGDGSGYEEPGEFPMWHYDGKNFLYVDYHAEWSKNTSGPFANKPTSGDTIGTCQDWGKPSDGGDWPMP